MPLMITTPIHSTLFRTKRELLSGFVFGFAICFSATAEQKNELITWDTQQLSPDFYGEGAYFGDFNRDGAVDVVSGPFWYEGPGFSK